MFEVINELFADIAVICHHEKLFMLTEKMKIFNGILYQAPYFNNFLRKNEPF